MRWWLSIAVGALACATPGSNDGPIPGDSPWGVDACAEAPVGEGYREGQVLPDFALTDQYGGTTNLYDFCDRVVLLEVAGFW